MGKNFKIITLCFIYFYWIIILSCFCYSEQLLHFNKDIIKLTSNDQIILQHDTSNEIYYYFVYSPIREESQLLTEENQVASIQINIKPKSSSSLITKDLPILYLSQGAPLTWPLFKESQVEWNFKNNNDSRFFAAISGPFQFPLYLALYFKMGSDNTHEYIDSMFNLNIIQKITEWSFELEIVQDLNDNDGVFITMTNFTLGNDSFQPNPLDFNLQLSQYSDPKINTRQWPLLFKRGGKIQN